MSAQPPDSNHDWRRDQNGRWYYLDAYNRRVDATAPRTTGPTPTILQYQPKVSTSSTGYQYNPLAPQGGSGPAGGSRPISIPAATNPAQQPGVGRGRGIQGPGLPQSPPASGYAQQLGGGRGQLSPTGTSPLQLADAQVSGAGRGRGNTANNAISGNPKLPASQQQRMIATQEQWGTLHEGTLARLGRDEDHVYLGLVLIIKARLQSARDTKEVFSAGEGVFLVLSVNACALTRIVAGLSITTH